MHCTVENGLIHIESSHINLTHNWHDDVYDVDEVVCVVEVVDLEVGVAFTFATVKEDMITNGNDARKM